VREESIEVAKVGCAWRREVEMRNEESENEESENEESENEVEKSMMVE